MKTGVLCGLGYNPVTNTSLYPDHDMDIGFDVQISTEDLVRVCFIFIFPLNIQCPFVLGNVVVKNDNVNYQLEIKLLEIFCSL